MVNHPNRSQHALYYVRADVAEKSIETKCASLEAAQAEYVYLLTHPHRTSDVEVVTVRDRGPNLGGLCEEYVEIGVSEAKYWAAADERYHSIYYTVMRSMAGRVRGPEYRVSYRLADGRGWLNGLRHSDRGDLMTDVAIAAKPWVR